MSRMNEQTVNKCPIHSAEDVQLFCKDCEKVICRECIITLHQKHEYLKLEDAIEKSMQNLENLIKESEDDILPNLKIKLEEIRKRKNDYSSDVEAAIMQIQENSNGLKEDVDDVTASIEKEIRNVQDGDENNWNQVISNFEKSIERVQTVTDSSKSFVTKKCVDAIYKYQELLELLNSNIDVPNIVSPTITSVKLDKQKLVKLIGTCDKLESDCDSDSLLKTPETSWCSYSTTGIRCVSEFRNSMAWMTNPSKTNVIDQIWLNGATFQFKTQIKLDSGWIVTGLALSKQENIYLTTSKSSVIYMIKKGSTKAKRFVDLGQFQPYGLCIAKDNCILATAIEHEQEMKENYFNRRAVVIRLSAEVGHVLQTIEFYEKKRLFYLPRFVKENANGDICVSEIKNKEEGRVVVVDSAGKLKFIRKFNEKNSKIHPLGIVCDKEERIIIADRQNDEVSVIDRDGKFIKRILSKSYGLSEPSALSIADDGQIFIGCLNSKIYFVKYC